MSTATSRKRVISKLLAASEQCLADESRLDKAIDETLRRLIRLLVRRYLNWNGKALRIGPESTDHQLSASELRRLVHARAASRGPFDHRLFAALVRDELRTAPEECAYVISGLFTANDERPAPEVVQRSTTPLIQLLTEMEKSL